MLITTRKKILPTILFPILLSALTVFTTPTLANTFPPNTHYQTCFTPNHPCTKIITNLINHAKQSIYVQAYSFTSRQIAHALTRAAKRGVNVNIILDSSQFDCQHFSYADYFIKHHIPTWNDNKLRIAHNKVIIIDNNTVETGSFNFTKSAQYHNAENVLTIRDHTLATTYLKNWQQRQKVSKPVHKAHCHYWY